MQTESKFNPLIVFANAYDCYPAIAALKEIPCDQLHVNYYPYPENYIEAETFFESHKEYTHLFYVAPDIVLNLQIWEYMKNYIIENNPGVYGCYCHVDTKKNKDSLACCLTLPSIAYATRNYRWLKESQRKHLIEKGLTVLKVKFNANLAFVRRDIKNKIKYMSLPYDTDERPIHESRGGYACDLAFCHCLDKMGIDPLVDLRFKAIHLRYAGKLQVGIKPKNTEFFKYDSKTKELCLYQNQT